MSTLAPAGHFFYFAIKPCTQSEALLDDGPEVSLGINRIYLFVTFVVALPSVAWSGDGAETESRAASSACSKPLTETEIKARRLQLGDLESRIADAAFLLSDELPAVLAVKDYETSARRRPEWERALKELAHYRIRSSPWDEGILDRTRGLRLLILYPLGPRPLQPFPVDPKFKNRFVRFQESMFEVRFRKMLALASSKLVSGRPAVIQTHAGWTNRAVREYTPEVEFNALIYTLGRQYPRLQIQKIAFVRAKLGTTLRALVTTANAEDETE